MIEGLVVERISSVRLLRLSRSLLVPAMLICARIAAGQDAPPSSAAASGESDEELAKKLSNPVSSMISVPFQNNFEFGIGEQSGFRWTLNVQPVVPLPLSPKWNLIVRTIMPVIEQSDVVAGQGSQFGLGDITQSFFFSPATGSVIWAVGPVMYYPSATDPLIGAKKWGAGATVLVLKQSSAWTNGILANHIWSFADAGGGTGRPDLSNTFLQPFLAYNTKTATTFSLNTESSYDWTNRQWTVPVNLFVSQLLRFGKQPVSIGLGYKYYAEKPASGPDWGIRFVFTLLLPS
jgi:hypothetical protein